MSRQTNARRRTLRALRIARRNTTGPVALFLYRRISRDKEGRELGVKRQSKDLREMAAREHPAARVFDDYCDNDRSASTNCDDERPDYDRMMRDARAAAESGQYSRIIIAAYTSGRLTRRPLEFEGQVRLAQDYMVEYHFLRSPSFDLNTAAGRRIARVMAAQDAGEPEDISERVLHKLDELFDNGEFTGGRPGFGFRLVYDYNSNGLPIKPGRLVIVDEEAELIRDGVNRLLGGETLNEIGSRWTEKTGKRYWPTDVGERLSRARNAGMTERHGEIWGRGKWGHLVDENDPDSEWCAIIAESELAAVRAKLTERARAVEAKRTQQRGIDLGNARMPVYGRRWLGSGKYRCGQPGCTGTLRGTGPAKKGQQPRYMCSSRWDLSIDAAAVDAKVRNQVAVLLAQHGVNLLAGVHMEEHERLTRDANRLRAKIDALAAAFAEDGEGSARALVLATRTLEKRLHEVEKARDTLVIPGKALEGIADAEDPVAAFRDAPLSRQQAVMDALVTVTIKPGRRGRQPAGTKLTDRVVIESVRTAISDVA